MIQDRAIRTRQTILVAAAKVFEERGYHAATITEIIATAGATKGALYFHFDSKKHLAQGILDEQGQNLTIPSRACKVQEIVDTVALHAYRLQTDPMVRAGVRLSLDPRATELDRSGAFRSWSEVVVAFLQKAQAQGELLPHVVTTETADILVGSYTGIQAMSQVISGYRDLGHRTSGLLRHVLPNVVLSSVLTTVDLSSNRGSLVYSEVVGGNPAAPDLMATTK